MRLTLNRGCVVTGAAILALLAGSLQSVAQDAVRQKTSAAYVKVVPHEPVAVHQWVNVTGVPSTIAISDAANNVVDIFNDAGVMLGQLTGFIEPQGMASDRQGNLYVADTVNNRIQVYAAGFTNPPTTWSDPGQYPAGVDVRNNGGFGAVTNIIDINGGPGSITLYRNGVAVATVTNPNFGRVYFCAFDHDGNLYLDGTDVNGFVFVAVIAAANRGGRTVQFLTTTNSISFPGGVQVNNNGTISIDDQINLAIYTYNPPSGGSLGSPVSTTSLGGSSDPVTFAFKVHNHNLYTADAGDAAANEYPYPAGGSPENVISIPGSAPIGVAVIPTQMP